MEQEKTYYGNAVVYLKFYTAKEYEVMNSPAPSSVHCFPIKDDNILFTVNPRGIDIIGGHVEPNETPIDTLIREAQEEACIIPINYRLIGAIEVDNRDNPGAALKGYPEKGYQLFYAVDDYEEMDFQANFECTDRKYVAISDIPIEHHKWLNTHQQILNELQNNTLQLKPVKKTI